MNRNIAMAAALLALAGCATEQPARVSTGAIKASTFDFVTVAPGKHEFADDSASTHASIQAAIQDVLAAKGLNRSEGGGDVKVAYLVIVGNNVTTTSINDYFGYGREDAKLVEQAHKASAVDNKNPDYYEAGALVIDIIDAKDFKLLRRDYVVRPLFRNTPPDIREARIRDAVSEALAELQVQ
ncbi:MAG TPA: DUF4136 domain-containing protein [Kiritimatiellia bacterium]